MENNDNTVPKYKQTTAGKHWTTKTLYFFKIYFSSAANLRTSVGMHNDQKYGKSFMTSHENSDRDNGAKMLII